MQRRDSRLLLSATDLVNFHECERLSALDRASLDDKALKAQRTKPDDTAELFFRKGHEFEASYLAELKRLHPGAGEVVEIADPFKDPSKAAAETLSAMRAGASIIYQATLHTPRCMRHPVCDELGYSETIVVGLVSGSN